MSGNKFAGGKHAIAQCDVCGQRYKRDQLRPQIIKMITTNIMACPECYDPDQPQLMQGMYPVNDPQAIRNPRPDQRNDVNATTPQIIGYTNPDGIPIFG